MKWTEVKDTYWLRIIEECADSLRKRGWEVIVDPNMDELLTVFKNAKSIGIPGSATIRELGLVDILRNDYDVLEHWDGPEDNIFRETECDVFLHSANAISKDGQVVIMDLYGNRSSGSIRGPEHLVIVAGRNKIVSGLDDAIKRAQTAADMNALRFSGNKEDIMGFTLIIHRKPMEIPRGTIILLNRELGY